MTKTLIYQYLGTNGVLSTPIHLEGIYSVKSYRLKADEGKMLTKDGKNLVQYVNCPESEINDWFEITIPEEY